MQITLTVVMEHCTYDYTFAVINNLTVDCILCADFLRKHKAILDCQNGTLVLGAHTIPIHTGYSHIAQPGSYIAVKQRLQAVPFS